MAITTPRQAAEEVVRRVGERRGGWRCVACGSDACRSFAEFGSMVNGGARHAPTLEKAFQTVMLICARCGFVHHHRLEDLETETVGPTTSVTAL